MTNRNAPFRTLVIAASAVATTAVMFGSAIAPAQASGVYYRATLAEPVERRTEIVRGGTFICEGTECVGSKARSRDEIVCERVVREFGAVTRFEADGEEFDAAALAACTTDA